MESVITKRARLHDEYYGAFSFFSMLPLEIIFMILEYVFVAHTRHGQCLKASFNFFLTCKGAHLLGISFYRHIYRFVGGVCDDYVPPFEVFTKTLQELSWSAHSKNALALMRIGIDKTLTVNRGLYTDRLTPSPFKMSYSISTMDAKMKCPALTRVILSTEGPNAIETIIDHALVDTIPRKEWLLRLKRESPEYLVQIAYFLDQGFPTLVSLIDSLTKWRDVAVYLYKLSVQQIGKLLTILQPDWLTCWRDVFDTWNWQDDLTEAVVLYAPEWLLRLPYTEGGDDNPLFHSSNIEEALWFDYKVKTCNGESRLAGVMPQNIAISSHMASFGNPKSALGFEEHVMSLGGTVTWK